ncbi:hypothetical protein HK104_008267 [Borealophlyctis nickersoniae]|nr:hypothetical protein HK104_008267 [Borealophlyctis nickersoniae]
MAATGWSDVAKVYELSPHRPPTSQHSHVLTCNCHPKNISNLSTRITVIYANGSLHLTGILPPTNTPLRILDVATGSGILALQVAETYKAAGVHVDVDATDVAEGMVNILRRKIEEKGVAGMVKADVMDAQVLEKREKEDPISWTLSFPTSTFTHAFMNFGIMFIPNPLQSLSELYRVLQPSGVACLTTWLPNDMGALAGAVMHRLPSSNQPTAPFKDMWSDPEYVKNILEDARFRHVEATPVARSVVFESYDELESVMGKTNPSIVETRKGWTDEYRRRFMEVQREVMREMWPVVPFEVKMRALVIVGRK